MRARLVPRSEDSLRGAPAGPGLLWGPSFGAVVLPVCSPRPQRQHPLGTREKGMFPAHLSPKLQSRARSQVSVHSGDAGAIPM